MENNPKKSKAFIITFILILLLLVAGYFLFKNRDQLFGTKGSSSISKIFSPLLGTSKNKDVKVIPDETKIPTDEGNKLTGTVITDVNGNKLVLTEAGENLKKGDVLYIARFNANKQPVVMKAIANDKNKSLVFGVAAEDIEMGSLGNILIEGILIGIPTNKREGTLWAVKNILYLSDKTYGGMTKNPPVTPSYTVPVGSVLKVDTVNGQIVVGKLTGAEQTNLNSLNSQFLNSAMGDFRDYWNSIFGSNSGGNIGTGSNFPLNSIIIPTGSNINTGTSTGSASTGGPGTNTGTGTDTNTGATKTEENICKNIEQNPLTFTDDEKARLAALLRKFYLISSTLRTSGDITTIYSDVEQQQTFITQTEELTQQCYDQIDPKMNTYGWVRHGNPWYSPTSGGTFPYTNSNTGYSDGSWSGDINVPAVERLLNIW